MEMGIFFFGGGGGTEWQSVSILTGNFCWFKQNSTSEIPQNAEYR